MKQAMINYVKQPKNDLLYTPEFAVKPLLKYLPEEKLTVWECCDGGGSAITKRLREAGYKVISTDIQTGFDFLKDKPDFEFDMIITNPPFSLKNQFLKKCYEYQKPFALLLPITALEGVERNKLFARYGISVIVLDRRINFMKEKKGSWFNTSWFIWNIGKNNKLYFEKVEPESIFPSGDWERSENYLA